MYVVDGAPLDAEELEQVDAYWRAANYLSVGQIYLMGNPLLREPLAPEQVKPRLLGHWGTTPGLNLLYAHLNADHRGPRPGDDLRDRSRSRWAGPGRQRLAGGHLHARCTRRSATDAVGMGAVVHPVLVPRRRFPVHVAPETPGSIHEGGELGYSLSHAYGAALDNPDLVVACVIGDGEAETGPLAASWHSNKFLDPVGDGAVLPILHLNGYKIANPTVLARIGDDELTALLTGYGHKPYLVEGDDPAAGAPAAGRDPGRRSSTRSPPSSRPPAPDGVDRTSAVADDRAAHPEGLDRAEGGRRAAGRGDLAGPSGAAVRRPRRRRAPRRCWRSGCAPTGPRSSSTRRARPAASVVDWLPRGDLRMGANPHTNGGRYPRTLELPDFRGYGVKAGETGREADPGAGRVAARRDDRQRRAPQLPRRRSGRDRVQPARRGPGGHRQGVAGDASTPVDQHLGRHGRVMEILSEHTCQGWLEGYLLTGRHGLFSCYEAFVHIVDSMVNQHAKWLKVTRHLDWRRPVPSLNYLLTSHVWRQDHNGFSHQDPGFIDHVMNKKAEVVRVYLPAGRQHPAVRGRPLPAQPRLRQRHRRRQATRADLAGHGRRRPALRPRAGHLGLGRPTTSGDPDVVLAAAGDVPTLEILAAADLLRQHLPDLKVRVVNVVDLMRLQPETEHPHGLPDAEFDAIFTTDRPVIFAYHGYPWLDPPPHLPPPRPPQPARPRLQGGRHHHHTVRHARHQRHGPLPPGHRRHRPGARPGPPRPRSCASRWSTSAPSTAPTSAAPARTCRRSATGPGPPGRECRSEPCAVATPFHEISLRTRRDRDAARCRMARTTPVRSLGKRMVRQGGWWDDACRSPAVPGGEPRPRKEN